MTGTKTGNFSGPALLSGRMTAVFTELAPGIRAFTLKNEQLEVTVLPDKGADIYSLVHRGQRGGRPVQVPVGGAASGPVAKSSYDHGTVDRGVPGWLATAPAKRRGRVHRTGCYMGVPWRGSTGAVDVARRQ